MAEVAAEVARVTYKPGWSFHVYMDDWEGPHILIVAPTPNAYCPTETIDLGIRSAMPPFFSADAVHVWLMWRLDRIETHELREFYRVDDVAIADPHRN
jgi:hypothetical protein